MPRPKEQTARQTYSQDVATDESEFDDVWPTRMPNSSLHYTGLYDETTEDGQAQGQQQNAPRQIVPIMQRRSAIAPGKPSIPPGTYAQGNTRFNVQYGTPPPGRKQKQQPHPNQNITTPPGVIYGQPYRDTEAPQTMHARKRRWGLHPLLYLGIGMLVMLFLWVGLTSLVSWGQWELNNINYGMPRTYQIDRVIDLNNDSPSNLTHIIFLNLNRKIEVITQPAGDISKTQIYLVTTLIEEGSELYPVTGYIKDVNGDGRPDIVVKIKDSYTALINTGTGFRQVRPGEQITI